MVALAPGDRRAGRHRRDVAVAGRAGRAGPGASPPRRCWSPASGPTCCSTGRRTGCRGCAGPSCSPACSARPRCFAVPELLRRAGRNRVTAGRAAGAGARVRAVALAIVAGLAGPLAYSLDTAEHHPHRLDPERRAGGGRVVRRRRRRGRRPGGRSAAARRRLGGARAPAARPPRAGGQTGSTGGTAARRHRRTFRPAARDPGRRGDRQRLGHCAAPARPAPGGHGGRRRGGSRGGGAWAAWPGSTQVSSALEQAARAGRVALQVGRRHRGLRGRRAARARHRRRRGDGHRRLQRHRPGPTLAEFEALVAKHEIHYYVGAGQPRASAAARLLGHHVLGSGPLQDGDRRRRDRLQPHPAAQQGMRW